MSMGKGRAEFLQKKIVEALVRAHHTNVDTETIKYIFGEDLIDDATIKSQVEKKKARPRIKVSTTIPDGHIGVLHPDGRAEIVKIGEEGLGE